MKRTLVLSAAGIVIGLSLVMIFYSFAASIPVKACEVILDVDFITDVKIAAGLTLVILIVSFLLLRKKEIKAVLLVAAAAAAGAVLVTVINNILSDAMFGKYYNELESIAKMITSEESAADDYAVDNRLGFEYLLVFRGTRAEREEILAITGDKKAAYKLETFTEDSSSVIFKAIKGPFIFKFYAEAERLEMKDGLQILKCKKLIKYRIFKDKAKKVMAFIN